MSVHLPARLVIPLVIVAATAATITMPSLALAQPAGDGGGGGGCVLGPLCGLGDLGQWLQQTITNILTDFLTGLATNFGDAIVGFINDVNFLTHTPENLSYNDDLVKQFVTATQVLADGLLAVVVLVSGYNVMLRPYMGGTYAGALEFLPRLLVGGILINTAAWWCRLAIDVNNAACGVFSAPTLSDIFSTALRVLGGDRIAGLLMVLVFIVMTILLVVQQLMRLALVDVLFILAPLAALLWILPQSQAWGRLWGRLFVGTVFAQAVQVLILRLGFNLTTGLPQLNAAGLLLHPLLGIAVLALVLKVPSLMGGGAAGGNIIASLVGTAASAAVGGGVGVGVRAALGAGARTVGRRS